MDCMASSLFPALIGRCIVIILVTASAVGLMMLCFGLLVLSRKRVFWTKQENRESNFKHSITLKVTGFDDEDCLTSGHVTSVLHSLHSVGPGYSPGVGFSDCSECSRMNRGCVEECYDCSRRLRDPRDISTCGCRQGLLSEGPFPGDIDPGLEYCSCPPEPQGPSFSAADTTLADRLCSSARLTSSSTLLGETRRPTDAAAAAKSRGKTTSLSTLLGEMRSPETVSAKSRGRTTSLSTLLGETRPPKIAASLRQTDDVKMQRSQTLGRTSTLPHHPHQDHGHHHAGLSPPSSEILQGQRLSKLDCILEGKPLICCESTAERMTDDEDQTTFPLTTVTG